MLLIKAIDEVLKLIDIQLRAKLLLRPEATLVEIEEALIEPLKMENAHSSRPPLEVKNPEDEPSKKGDGTPQSALTASVTTTTTTSATKKKKQLKEDDHKKPPEAEQPKTKTDVPVEQARRTSIDSFPKPSRLFDAVLLKFNMIWGDFLDQDPASFKKTMVNSLSLRTKECSLDALTHNKLLILFRFRRQLEKMSLESQALLKAREEALEAAEILEVGLGSIDDALLKKIESEIKTSEWLLRKARKLASVTTEGTTEPLMHRISLFLTKYVVFCKEVDERTRQSLSSPYAFQDMLPGTLKLKDEDSVIQTHLTMMEYIRENLDLDSIYLATEKVNKGSLKGTLNYYLTTYKPEISQDKRHQVVSYFVAINDKVKPAQTPNQRAPKDYADSAVLECVDIYWGNARNIIPAPTMFMLANKLANTIAPGYEVFIQKLNKSYSTSHKETLEHASKGTQDSHKCLAIRFST